jgi:hypothetical protein
MLSVPRYLIIKYLRFTQKILTCLSYYVRFYEIINFQTTVNTSSEFVCIRLYKTFRYRTKLLQFFLLYVCVCVSSTVARKV